MDGLSFGDSKTQLKAIAMSKGDAMSLYEALTNLSISLVMGQEQYLRRFETLQAMPLLIGVLEKYSDANNAGDIMVMCLRSISLIFEHVPSSYDGAQEHHKPLMKYVFKAIHKALCAEWVYGQLDTESLYEECLRTARFIFKDDRTGTVMRHAYVGDLLTLCASENTLLSKQALECLLMLCTKVVMPSELEKPQQSSGFLSLFKSKKKSRKSHEKAVSVDDSDNPVVINVENVIAPFLHTLIEQYTAALPHVQEVWTMLEFAIQCLGTLMERALLCYRPHTASVLVPRELPQLLFHVITLIEENVTLEANMRNERILFIESVLATVTSCHSNALAESLLKDEAKKFFHSILEDSSSEITTLLDQPFPLGLMAARSTQRRDKDHITSVAAIRLLVLATPNVPPEAFGLKPKVVLPVHQWMWEDELRHANRLVEEQCVALETSWARLSKDSAVVVHNKALPADLLTMTMARGFSGGFRNIARSFAPFVYHFVDETSVRPIAKVKQSGPDPVSAPALSATMTSSPSSAGQTHHQLHGARSSSKQRDSKQRPSLTASDKHVVMNENAYVPESHIAIAEEYFVALCEYATYTSGQMAKQLATCACASLLQMMFLTNADARVAKLMSKAMLPMCEMFRSTLSSADKATKAVVLTMTEWMLRHSMASDWTFCDMAQRCGYVSLLEEMSKVTPTVIVTKDAKPTRTADLADRSGDLLRDITARLKRQRGAAASATVGVARDSAGAAPMAADTARLTAATEALWKVAKEPGRHEEVLKEFFDAIVHSKSVTSYEVYQMELASAALAYLLGGMTAQDLLGSSFVFSSGASGSTFSRDVVESVDIGAMLVGDEAQQSPALAMMSGGMRASDVLHVYTSQQRLQCFAKLVAAAPKGLQQLVEHLVGTLTLQSTFPSVESIVTHERVACKTPLQAFQALSDISPRAILCGKAGRFASPTYVKDNSVVGADYVDTREQSNIFSELVPKSSAPAGPARPGPGGGAAAPAAAASAAASVSQQPKDYCMRGHRLKEMPSYPMSCVCDFCGSHMKTGYACRICNFDICRTCHLKYKGNATLLQMMLTPQSMPRNRANLVSCIGDIERYFRTGSTSTKGTQVAPTSQSSLSHLDRFATRAELLLSRKANDEGAPKAVAEVARLLLQHPSLLRSTLFAVLQGFYTRGVLPGNPDGPTGAGDTAAFSGDGHSEQREAPKGTMPPAPPSEAPKLTDAQAKIAEELGKEALEDRYILYRPTVGRCTYQETFLGVVYQQAFALGNRQVLLQLENCLLRHEGSNDPLTLQSSVLPSPRNMASSVRNRASSVADTGSAPNNNSMAGTAGGAAGGGGEDEFTDEKISSQQNFVFHHFENDSATRCSCGAHSREDFSAKGVSEMTVGLPDFARRPDIMMLILLHRTFYSPSHRILVADVDRNKLDAGVFINSAVTTAVVKSLEASALRCAVLTPKLALPRWTWFVLSEARFLVPARVRERIARYLAYSARRSFVMYMRLFRQYRLDRTVSISPGEWARMSNHKFTINRADLLRDAFAVLRKAADARLPISIEFVGDVGVGQGPTAQFYTLLAQEVSRASLDLWRNVTLASSVSSASDGAASKASPRVATKRDAVPVATTHRVPATATTSTAAAVAIVNPPAEGFYPTRTHADGNALVRVPKALLLTGTPVRAGAAASSAANAFRASPPASVPGSTRGQRAHGQIVLTDARATLQDYVQTQRERAMAFYAVGAALGRAFVDEQVFPVPLCAALAIFLRSGIPPAKIVLPAALRVDKDAEAPVDLLELPMRVARLVDPSVASSLESLAQMDEAALQALELPFTLPGDDDFELIPGGTNVFVTANNLKRYQRRVVNALLYDSVAFPLRMLTAGCHDVVPREALAVLEVDELTNLLCGEEKGANEPLWSAEEIRSVLVGDHGYQNDSPQLEMLANILAKKLDPKEQRAFLLFCTGCPRLPVGGVRALGAITVVKRSNAFAHARGMAAAEERRIHGDDDPDDPDDDASPLLSGAAATTVGSNVDASSSNGGRAATPQWAASSLSRPSASGVAAGTNGTGDATSYAFELPDSEWALPSVNTCFKYLKLPPYPSEDLMHRKLVVSITQCGDTFELS